MARDKVFISYSHADRAMMDELKTMLSPVLKNRVVIWDDTQIQPGAKWRAEIQTALDATRVGVLLVSDNFLSSGFITNEEVPQLLKAAQQDGATLFWVCLSPCLWQYSPVAEYQAANAPEKPLDQIPKSKRKVAWQTICLKLLQVAPAPATSPAPEPKSTGAIPPAPKREMRPEPAKPAPMPKTEFEPSVERREKEPVPPELPPKKSPPPPTRQARHGPERAVESAPQPAAPSPPPAPLPTQPAAFNPVGRWRVEVMALVHSTVTMDLYANATCQGIQDVPYLGSLPFQGAWVFDMSSRTLTIQGIVQTMPFMLAIQIQGGQGNNYTGLGTDGIAYRFTRLS